MSGEKRTPLMLRMIDAFLLGVFNFVRFLARFVPPSLLWAVADGIGYVLYRARPEARDYLLKTLREALPDVEEEREYRRIAKKIFASTILVMLDLIILERYGQEIDARLDADPKVHEAISKLDRERAKGNGVIIFTPHIGGVGIITCIAARFDRAYTPLVMPPSLTPVPRYLSALTDMGERLGCDPENPVFWTGMDVIPKVQEHLKQGRVIGITFDLPGGTIVDFFGHPTAVASGIANFACDSGASILPGYLLRGETPLDYRLTCFDPLSYELTGDRETDVNTILEAVIRAGERLIRDAPDQWIGWLGLRGWRKKAEKIMKSEG